MVTRSSALPAHTHARTHTHQSLGGKKAKRPPACQPSAYWKSCRLPADVPYINTSIHPNLTSQTHRDPRRPTHTLTDPHIPTQTHAHPHRPTQTTWTHADPHRPTQTHADPHRPTQTYADHEDPRRPTQTDADPQRPTQTLTDPRTQRRPTQTLTEPWRPTQTADSGLLDVRTQLKPVPTRSKPLTTGTPNTQAAMLSSQWLLTLIKCCVGPQQPGLGFPVVLFTSCVWLGWKSSCGGLELLLGRSSRRLKALRRPRSPQIRLAMAESHTGLASGEQCVIRKAGTDTRSRTGNNGAVSG